MPDAPDQIDRKKLTFEQAEGAAPLPSQLKLKEVSQQLRSLVWLIFHGELQAATRTESMGGVPPWIGDPWVSILRDWWVFHHHRMVDEFDSSARQLTKLIKDQIAMGTYTDVLGLVQFVLRHPKRPRGLETRFADAFELARAAYRVVDGTTIVPFSTEEEHAAIRLAFSDLAAPELSGARKHLRTAADELSAGNYAESVRGSIDAVESVARVLDPGSATLDPALKRLAAKVRLHPALVAGFGKLYGYTSDEKGVRHALLDEPTSPVDETDALYMFGSCAAFVTYLVRKARAAGLLPDETGKK